MLTVDRSAIRMLIYEVLLVVWDVVDKIGGLGARPVPRRFCEDSDSPERWGQEKQNSRSRRVSDQTSSIFRPNSRGCSLVPAPCGHRQSQNICNVQSETRHLIQVDSYPPQTMEEQAMTSCPRQSVLGRDSYRDCKADGVKPDETRVVLRLGPKEMIDISVRRPTRSSWACVRDHPSGNVLVALKATIHGCTEAACLHCADM